MVFRHFAPVENGGEHPIIYIVSPCFTHPFGGAGFRCMYFFFRRVLYPKLMRGLAMVIAIDREPNDKPYVYVLDHGNLVDVC